MKRFHPLFAVFAFSIFIASCNELEVLETKPCNGIELVRLSSFEVTGGFFPLNNRYYWLYYDSTFNSDGSLERASVRMLTANEGYTSKFRERKSPILVSFNSILPDLAFRNDTVFRLPSSNDLHRSSCMVITGPFLFPTSDSVFFIPKSEVLAPLNRDFVTPAGTFSDNYIRKGNYYTYIFSREVGLLHFSQMERIAATGEVWLKRSVWLKEAVLDPSYGDVPQKELQ